MHMVVRLNFVLYDVQQVTLFEHYLISVIFPTHPPPLIMLLRLNGKGSPRLLFGSVPALNKEHSIGYTLQQCLLSNVLRCCVENLNKRDDNKVCNCYHNVDILSALPDHCVIFLVLFLSQLL